MFMFIKQKKVFIVTTFQGYNKNIRPKNPVDNNICIEILPCCL